MIRFIYGHHFRLTRTQDFQWNININEYKYAIENNYRKFSWQQFVTKKFYGKLLGKFIDRGFLYTTKIINFAYLGKYCDIDIEKISKVFCVCFN